MATLTLRPNAAGDYQQWSTFGSGSAHYDRVSDQSDLTGVQVTGNITLKETEHLQDHGVITGVINSVTAYIRHYTTGTGAKEYAVIIWKLDITEIESLPFAISRGGFGESSDDRTEKPGGGSWTWSNIDALQIGVRCTALGGSEIAQVSELWIVVNYTPGVVPQAFNKLAYTTEPPTTGAFNKLKFISEPPVPGAWNKLAYEGE